MADKPHDFIDQYQALVRDGLEAWSRQFDPKGEPSAANPSADIMGRMFTGLGGYGDWLRSMATGEPSAAPFAMGGMPPFGGPGPGAAPFGPGGPGFAAAGMGPSPFAAGAPFGGAASGMPSFAPFGYGPPPGAAAPPGSESFDDWARVARETLSMPAFGLTREQQEEQQALLRAWIDYVEHHGRYQALLQGVHDRAMAALREQAAPTDADSMRSVYDRWVNLAEQSYAEAALSAEFREVYASLVNAQMRLKLLQQRQIERIAAQLGMPTRKDVDSLGERMQAVRRELRHMQGLAAQVEALKVEVAVLRGERSAAKTSTKKVVSKKVVASKVASGSGASGRSASKKIAAQKVAATNGAGKKSTARKRTAGKSAAKPADTRRAPRSRKP